LLSHYATVALLYPQSYKSEHRTCRYIQWLTDVAENFSVAKCHEIVAQFNQQVSEVCAKF
jgi:hypothetical protein